MAKKQIASHPRWALVFALLRGLIPPRVLGVASMHRGGDSCALTAFSDEVSEARIWPGFHYRFSTKVGQDMGHKIGEYVAKNLMQPVAVGAR